MALHGGSLLQVTVKSVDTSVPLHGLGYVPLFPIKENLNAPKIKLYHNHKTMILR